MSVGVSAAAWTQRGGRCAPARMERRDFYQPGAGQRPAKQKRRTLGTKTVNRVAKWDGTNWSALGAGVSDTVFALAGGGTNVYVGGDFTATLDNGQFRTLNRIARWDGTTWSPLGSGVDNTVFSLAVS